MADQHSNAGGDTGYSGAPEDDPLEAPGSGDLGPSTAGGAMDTAAKTGKNLAQKGLETGVKKATGSDMAVSALRGAQKARSGDAIGGAQDIAASGAGALTTLAVGSTGVGAPVAGAAGSVVTSIFQTKAFRYVLAAIAALTVGTLVLQIALLSLATAAVVTAVFPSTSQATSFSQTCTDGSGGAPGPSDVVGGDIEEQVWNYVRGAGYTEEQTAGVMGNLKHESQFNPWAAENASDAPAVGKGWGLAQWTADRHAAVRDAAIAELGDDFYFGAPDLATIPSEMSEDDVDTMVLFQLRYIIRELETNEKAAGDHLASTTTVEEASRSFETMYERPESGSTQKRISHAQAYLEQYSGSAVPDSGGTEPGGVVDSTGTEEADAEPSEKPPAAPADVADSVDSASNSGCSGTSITSGSDTGSVTPCPDGGDEGCVNLAALTKPSSSLSCPDGTTDGGTTTAYYEGNGVPIRLCALSGITDVGGRPVIMNATIAPAFLAFYAEAQSAGLELTFSSSYRSHASQQSIYARSPGNAARPGWSNHEFGMAFDISGFSPSYNRNNCGSTQTPENACSYPGSGAELERWKKLREIGLNHGMYIHDQEFWHIEFIPSGMNRDRNIPVYEG